MEAMQASVGSGDLVQICAVARGPQAFRLRSPQLGLHSACACFIAVWALLDALILWQAGSFLALMPAHLAAPLPVPTGG